MNLISPTKEEKIGLFLFFFATVAIPLLLMALGALQSSGTPPEFTCAPGEVYTTKECP